MIDDYITRGVNAIVITPISADGSVAALKKAKDAGITIICFNTCVNDKTIPSGFLVTKNEDLGIKSGEAAVKFITDKLGGKAKVGVLNCDQFEGCPPRKAGFEEQLKALSGVEVVADQAGWLADKAQPVSEAMLQANPDINVLWAANEGGTVAHANAVKTLGLGGKVFVFGTDMNNQMGQMLQAEDDILQGVTGQAPYQMGYDALNSALDVLGGKQVAEVTNTPTIFFGRGQDALIKQFMDTEGNAIFEVPAAGESSAPAPSGEKALIAGVVFQSDTFMQTVQAGMQAAADKLGAEVILGNTDNKLDKEASMIDDYITRGVKAIVITPISADGSVAALKRAKDAGITIICFNTCVNDKTIPSGFLVTKNEDLGIKSGEAAVKFITDKLGGKAKVGVLNCDQFEGCPPRKAGFEEQLKALSGVEVVADQAGWLADKAQPVSEAMLQANPDINVLWAANEGGTVAHANAVKTLGLGGKVFVFGTDMNNQMGQMLQAEDDILQGVTGQAPYQMGYDALATAMDVLGGKKVAEVTNTPTIFFGRGQDALIKQFMDTEGNAIFEVPAAEPQSSTEPMPNKKLTVAGVVFQSDTFMQTVQAGMQAAADKTGAELILGNTDNKLDKEASMIDDYITRGVDAIVITPISADGSVAALKKRQGRRHHDHLLQHLRQRQDHPLRLPRHQERGSGHQVRRGCGQVHHRQARRQGQGRRPQLRPVRRLPAPQGRLPGATEGPARRRGRGRSGRLAGRQGAAGLRGHAAGASRHQRPVGRQRRRHRGARQRRQDPRPGRQGVRLRHRHEQPDGPDAPGGGQHPPGCHRPGPLPDGLRRVHDDGPT